MSFMGAKAVEDLLKGIGKEEFERKYGDYKNDKRIDETDGKEKEGFCFK